MNDTSGRTPEPGSDAANRSARPARPATHRTGTPCLIPALLAARPPAPGRTPPGQAPSPVPIRPSRAPLPWPGSNHDEPHSGPDSRGNARGNVHGDAHEEAREAALTRLALAARAGDRAARDELYTALEPNIRRMVAGCARLTWATDCPRREGRPWDREDLAQEAFLVFSDLLRAWPGEGPVTPYLFAYFPWRLRNAWRKLRPDRPRGGPILRAEPGLAADASATAAEAAALLAVLASELPPVESAILLLHVRDGLSLAEIGRRFGVRPRQVGRRWAGIKRWLRGELALSRVEGRRRRVPPPDVPPDPA